MVNPENFNFENLPTFLPSLWDYHLDRPYPPRYPFIRLNVNDSVRYCVEYNFKNRWDVYFSTRNEDNLCLKIRDLEYYCLSEINDLHNIHTIDISGLNIQSITNISNIQNLIIHDCPNLTYLVNFENIQNLSIVNCPNLN